MPPKRGRAAAGLSAMEKEERQADVERVESPVALESLGMGGEGQAQT